MFRVGLMGCGTVADYGHSPALHAVPELELASVFDPAPGRAADFARRHSVAGAFENAEAFFASGLDAVVVCSPAPAHRANVLDAARHGVHVLCEKPIAMNDAEAREMSAAMSAAGKGLAVGFVYRYAKISAQIKRWVEEGRIGRVRSIRLSYVWHLHGRFTPEPDGVWKENPVWRGRMLEGGPMVDCGVHFIDLARWWTGSEIVAARGEGAYVVDGYDAPDHVYGHLDHADGCHTMAETSFSYGHTAREPGPVFTYDVIGDGGTIRYDRDGWRLTLRDGEGVRIGEPSAEKGFVEMHQAFARALATGDWSGMPSPDDGLKATHWANEITRQAESRKPAVKTTDKA
jgi:predicted dehydrogenase